MSMTPRDLKKVLDANPTDHGRSVGFVASHFQKVRIRHFTPRQQRAMWRDPSRRFAWAK